MVIWWLTKRLLKASAQGIGALLMPILCEMMKREGPKRTRILVFDFIAKIEKDWKGQTALTPSTPLASKADKR